MDEVLEWKFLQSRHTNSQQVKVINVTNHQGNDHQNHNDVLLHAC